MKDYELKLKRPDTGKFWGYGAIKKNKFDKYQASFKVTPEFKALVLENDGGWLNFSLFEPYVKPETIEPETREILDKMYADDEKQNHPSYDSIVNEIPF